MIKSWTVYPYNFISFDEYSGELFVLHKVLYSQHEFMKNTHKHTISTSHGVQRRMISVDNFFVFLRLLFFALLLLYVT